MAPLDVAIDNPGALPGAFLIRTVKYANPKRQPNTVIAYDPEILPGDKFSKCVPRWTANGLPYREDFTKDTVASFGPTDFYSK